MWILLFDATAGLAINFSLRAVLIESLDERPRGKRRPSLSRSYR